MRMTKNLLTIALAATMMISVPVASIAAPMIEIVDYMDIDQFGVTISVNQNVLHVSGAAGQTLQVYNVAGVCVMNVKIDGDEKHYDLNLQKGCYIVKVGKVVRKISVR